MPANPRAVQHVSRCNRVTEHDPVVGVFGYWQTTMGSATSKLDAKRIGLIRNALKLGYTPRQLCEAIKGCASSPFHMGQNDRKTKYNSLKLILRDADNIDKFIELTSYQATAGGLESIEQRNERILAELMRDASSIDVNTLEMETDNDDEG